MKISTTFDFGDTTPVEDIEIDVTVHLTVKEMWSLPELRETIADNIVPHLKRMHLNEKGISEVRERILLSGELDKVVSGLYRYDAVNHQIVDVTDCKKVYPVSDYLKGKLPDQ